jgi:hypothetical protein
VDRCHSAVTSSGGCLLLMVGVCFNLNVSRQTGGFPNNRVWGSDVWMRFAWGEVAALQLFLVTTYPVMSSCI